MGCLHHILLPRAQKTLWKRRQQESKSQRAQCPLNQQDCCCCCCGIFVSQRAWQHAQGLHRSAPDGSRSEREVNICSHTYCLGTLRVHHCIKSYEIRNKRHYHTPSHSVRTLCLQLWLTSWWTQWSQTTEETCPSSRNGKHRRAEYHY